MVTSIDPLQEEKKRGRRRFGGVKFEVKSVGGEIGLLVFGGALIAAAGAAFAVYRSGGSKRRRQPRAVMKPNTEAYLEEEAPEKKGLQSIFELNDREGDHLNESLMEVKENPETETVADGVCDCNVQELVFTEQGMKSLEDLEYTHVDKLAKEEEQEEKEGSSSNVSEYEVKLESSETEEEGDAEEEGSDSTGASSVESSSDAVWPVEVIEEEKQPLLTEYIEVENKVENKTGMEEQIHNIKEDLRKEVTVEEAAENTVKAIVRKIKNEAEIISVAMNDHPRGIVLLFLWISMPLVLLLFFGCVHLYLSHHVPL